MIFYHYASTADRLALESEGFRVVQAGSGYHLSADTDPLTLSLDYPLCEQPDPIEVN